MSDRHSLTTKERALSQTATLALGFPAIVYQDGGWICQPRGSQRNGYGSNPTEAIEDCEQQNRP